MTGKELTVLLHHPDETGLAVNELARLVEEYPYFHTGYMLYLKGLQLTDAGKMASQLAKTALCVRDRAVLYHYINSPAVTEQQPLSETVPAGETMLSDEQLLAMIDSRLEQIAAPHDEITDTADNIQPSILASGDLIDAFLNTNPKIVPDDRQHDVDLSDSLQENSEMPTRTLACIYAAQGHNDKAIKIYEQLILLYPEKYAYFAAEIERLKS